jgi:phage-related minor tail protein
MMTDEQAKTEVIKLDGRVTRLEEKFIEVSQAVNKLADKVEDLGNQIKRATYLIVGGAAVISMLATGTLANIIKSLTGGV